MAGKLCESRVTAPHKWRGKCKEGTKELFRFIDDFFRGKLTGGGEEKTKGRSIVKFNGSMRL